MSLVWVEIDLIVKLTESTADFFLWLLSLCSNPILNVV